MLRTLTQTASRPRLEGDGPATCSTSQVVTLRPIYDVNGYYRDLGVSPRASKHAIAKAYHQSGRDDAHLTFVVKQLLDPVTRGLYDACGAGEIFLDIEVLHRIRLARFDHAGPLSVADGTVGDTEIGRPSSAVDDLRIIRQDCSHPRVWAYSFYVWDTILPDLGRLERWQQRLVSGLSDRGCSVQIAVGATAGDHPPFEVRRVGFRLVAFLHENHRMTDALVRRAVSQLHTST